MGERLTRTDISGGSIWCKSRDTLMLLIPSLAVTQLQTQTNSVSVA